MNKPNAQHVEEIATDDQNTDTKVTAVYSVALTDALVKDKHRSWSSSMLQLYGIMMLVTLSMETVQQSLGALADSSR